MKNNRICQFPYFPNVIRREKKGQIWKEYATVDSNPIGHLVNIYTIRKSAKPICTLYISVVVWHYIESDLVTYPVLSFILFQICRDECEVLEYQLCQKELAIARSQPMISHQLVLPDCKELPVIGWVAKSWPYFFPNIARIPHIRQNNSAFFFNKK